MIIGSFNKEFQRYYIKYLFSEVYVIPIEDLEIKLLSGSIRLIAGEESKIPRWLAYILLRYNKIKIKSQEDPRDLIGRLTYYSFREREGSPLPSMEQDLFFKLKEYSQKLDINMKKKINEILENFVKIRLPKILRRALTTGYEGEGLLWEDVLARYIRKLSNKWLEALTKGELPI